MGLGPKWAAFGTTANDPPGATAKMACELGPLDPKETVHLVLRDPMASYGPDARRTVRVTVDGRERGRVEMAGQLLERVPITADLAGTQPVVEIELSPRPQSPPRLGDAPIQIDLEKP
jgi:hypothetical protein